MSRPSATSVLIASSVVAVMVAVAVPDLGLFGADGSPDGPLDGAQSPVVLDTALGSTPIRGMAVLQTREAADEMGNLVSRTIRAPWRRGQSADDWAASLASTTSATVVAIGTLSSGPQAERADELRMDAMPVSTSATWTTVHGSQLSIELRPVNGESPSACADRHVRVMESFYAQFEPLVSAQASPRPAVSHGGLEEAEGVPKEAAFHR